MRELLTHLPIVGTCGVIALLAGPLARLPINLGAWLLKWLCRPTRAGDARQAALRDSDNGITRWRTAVRKRARGDRKTWRPVPSGYYSPAPASMVGSAGLAAGPRHRRRASLSR